MSPSSVLVIDIALGASPAEECPAVEAGMLTIDVLVAAIAHALDGCPG